MSTTNITIPMGKLYWDPDGLGERLFGQTRNGTIKISQAKETVFDTDNPSGGVILDVPYNIQRELSFQVAEIEDWVVELFTRTAPSTVSQASGSVSGEVVPWNIGRTVQLGKTLSNPAGNRDISSLVLSQGIVGGNPFTVATTAYSIDLELGRLTILAASGGQVGVNVTAAYTKAAQSWTRLQEAPDVAPVVGAIRFVANNVHGPNRDIYIPNISLTAEGDLTLKGDSTQKATTVGFKGLLMRVDTTPALIIDGRPA